MLQDVKVDSRVVRNKTVGFYKVNYSTWIRVRFDDIVYIETVPKLPNKIVFKDGEIIYSTEPLTKIALVLPFKFERIHRSHVVNIDYVDQVDYRHKMVILKSNVKLKLGSGYVENIAKYFI